MMVLEYLSPSKARRDLLRILHSRKGGLTIRQLSHEANVAYSNAHMEINRMRQLGLVRTEQAGSAILCSWVAGSSAAKSLAPLLRELERNEVGVPSDNAVYWNLRRMVAPLSTAGSKGEVLSLEDTLGYALPLARKYPDVAKVWPVVFAKHRSQVDLEALARVAGRLGQKRSLGFFLDLTRTLLGDSERARQGKLLRDRRFKKTQDFFVGTSTERAQELAELRTPKVAKNWHFRMNMPLESFQATFDKFGARPS